MGNLVDHATNEMKLAGLFDPDSDYAGGVAEGVLALVKAHEEQGHSGGSHQRVLEVFNRVINFKTLTPLTDDPGEWMEIGCGEWQSRRHSSAFSKDGGKTFFDIDKDRRIIKHTVKRRPDTQCPKGPQGPKGEAGE